MKRVIKQVFFAIVLIVALTGVNMKASRSLLRTEIEPELELENWMVDESFWNKASVEITPAQDSPLEIEAWMTDDNYWR